MILLALPFFGLLFLLTFGPLLAVVLEYGIFTEASLVALIASIAWWVFLRALYVTFIKEVYHD